MSSFEPGLSATDQLEITALIHSYCWLIDDGDFDALGQLFAHADVHYRSDAAIIRRDPKALADLHRSFVRIYPQTGTPCTRHACSNILVSADSIDTARARSAIMVFQATPDFPLQAIVGAQYRDRFARINGAWAFVERHVDVELVGDLSAHLLVEIGVRDLSSTGPARS